MSLCSFLYPHHAGHTSEHGHMKSTWAHTHSCYYGVLKTLVQRADQESNLLLGHLGVLYVQWLRCTGPSKCAESDLTCLAMSLHMHMLLRALLSGAVQVQNLNLHTMYTS